MVIIPGLEKPNINNKKDVVIGCIKGYNYPQIELWINSLEQSGFEGDKLMIVYREDYRQELITKLKEKQFQMCIIEDAPEEHVVVDRFLRLWQVINLFNLKEKYNRVISTDIRDVVFQTNPTKWLDENFELTNKKIVVGSECLEYKDEPWGDDNMKKSFPFMYGTMKNKIIYNAGTIAGKIEEMGDLFLNIYLCSRNNKNVHNADQASLNVLLQTRIYANLTQFNSINDGWCAQIGTLADPNKMHFFNEKLKEKNPIIIQENGEVFTSDNKPFCLIHQYDRNPKLNEIIKNRFK